MAQHRIGAGACRDIAAQPSLSKALPLLANSAYAERLAGSTSLAAAERSILDSVLWELRVLAGWLPANGTRVLRAMAAAYERDNIVALAKELEGNLDIEEPYELGTLATAWPQLQLSTTSEELVQALEKSPWQRTGSTGVISLRDELTLVWLRRLANVAPPTRSWGAAASALILARVLVVDGDEISTRLTELIRPVLGQGWEKATGMAELRRALPKSVQSIFADIETPEELWRAEARLRAKIQADGFNLLHHSTPGPEVVLGTAAVLAIDGWRIRVALAAAAAGLGTSEVLDAVA